MREYSEEIATRNDASAEARARTAEALKVKIANLEAQRAELRTRLDQTNNQQVKKWQYGETLKALLVKQEEALLAMQQPGASPEEKAALHQKWTPC